MRPPLKRPSTWLPAAILFMVVGAGPRQCLALGTGTVTDLTVWLKADAGVVTNGTGTVINWLDQSGNGYNGINSAAGNPTFTADSAELDHMPALVFDGSDSGITLGILDSSFPTAATLFVVASINNDPGYNIFITRNNATWWRYHGDSRAYPGMFRASRLESYATTPDNGACLFQVDSSASLWQMFINGASSAVAAADYLAGDTTGYRIGYGPDAGGFHGHIAEVLIYSRVLTSNEAIKVGGYLVDKYALPAPIIDPDLPAINNGSGVSNLTATTALLCGNLVRTGRSTTAVSVYYGLSDGGMNPGAWDVAHHFGVTNPAVLPARCTYAASSLLANRAYYYTFAASNASDRIWPKTREHFITGNVWLEKLADASEIGLTPGTVRVCRVATATNCTLNVNYQMTGGDAVAGQDFAAFTGYLTIPSGASNATFVITPLANWIKQTDSTLELTVDAGGYQFGASSNISMTIHNEPPPAAPTNAWTATTPGNASTAANWTAGHAPKTNEIVLLSAVFSQQPMTWDVTNAVATWHQAADYTGTVTIPTTYGPAFPVMSITGNCQVLGGTWTHPVGSVAHTELNRLRVAVGGDFTLGGNATINLNEKGFAAQYYGGYGPGRSGVDGNYERGVSHGGLGGNSSAGTPVSWTKVYGSIASPTNLGSSTTTAGGGALYLTVQGAAMVDGTINAKGGNGSYISASAGGSIYLVVGTLAGTGTLSVAGGATWGQGGGAGGGGRIAVILNTGTTFGSVAMKAHGGASSPSQSGAAGTIYRQTSAQAAGEGSVTIDNNNIVTTSAMTMATPNEPDMTQFSEVILTNRGFLALNTNTMLDWIAQPNLKVYGPNQSLLMAQNTNNISLASDFSMANFALYLYTNLTVAGNMLVSNAIFSLAVPIQPNLVVQGNLHVATNGSMTHWLGNESYRLNCQVNGNFTLDAGGSINVNGLGFFPGTGPGKGSANNANTAPAASHGGLGAPKPGVTGQPVTYGSILAPTNFGSGAHSYGGGAVEIHVAGTSTVNGIISAKSGTPGLAVGSGGSIYLVTGWLQGNGTLDVSSTDFGYNPAPAQNGGGGGRIAVCLTHSSSFGSVSMKAYGCKANGAPYAGAAGTIYKQTAAQAAGLGTILVNNNGVATSTNITTQLPPYTNGSSIASLRYVTLRATNAANVELLGDLVMGDLYVCDDTSRLRLNGHTLKLQASYHADWGTDSRVVYNGGQIIWTVAGSVLILQ